MFLETAEIWLDGFFVVKQEGGFRSLAYPDTQHVFNCTVIFYGKNTACKLCRLRMGMMFINLKSVKKIALGPMRFGNIRYLAPIVVKINAIY